MLRCTYLLWKTKLSTETWAKILGRIGKNWTHSGSQEVAVVSHARQRPLKGHQRHCDPSFRGHQGNCMATIGRCACWFFTSTMPHEKSNLMVWGPPRNIYDHLPIRRQHFFATNFVLLTSCLNLHLIHFVFRVMIESWMQNICHTNAHHQQPTNKLYILIYYNKN